MNFDLFRKIIAIIYIMFALLFFMIKINKRKKYLTNDFIAKAGIFSAISIILYCFPLFHISLPFFPSFLEIHIDEVPVLIAGFAYGPLNGFFVLLIKTIAKLPLTTSACIGEFADLIFSTAFIVPASIIYKKIHHFKGALLACLIGSIIQLFVASFLTTFVMLDIYSFLYPGLTKEVILGICKSINPLITSLSWPFLLMVALPFNALKDAVVVVLTLILYKKLHTFVDKIGQEKNRN